MFSTDVVTTMDVHHQIDRLKISKALTTDESALIYLALNSEIRNYDQLNLVRRHFENLTNLSYCRRCQWLKAD